MNRFLSYRMTYFIGFLIILAIALLSVYLQFEEHILPCPLCVLQRICLGALGIIFLIGAAFNLKKCGRRFISFLAFLSAFTGAVLAGRQVWLQHNPLGLSSNCDVDFFYMIKVLPLTEVFKRIFQGGTECSQVNWQFLHLSLAEWSLLWFMIFSIVAVWQFCRSRV